MGRGITPSPRLFFVKTGAQMHYLIVLWTPVNFQFLICSELNSIKNMPKWFFIEKNGENHQNPTSRLKISLWRVSAESWWLKSKGFSEIVRNKKAFWSGTVRSRRGCPETIPRFELDPCAAVWVQELLVTASGIGDSVFLCAIFWRFSKFTLRFCSEKFTKKIPKGS